MRNSRKQMISFKQINLKGEKKKTRFLKTKIKGPYEPIFMYRQFLIL